jgi:hypothetical protein
MGCEEDNLRKFSMWERPVADTTDDLKATFDDRDTSLVWVEYKAGDVFARHDRKLLLEEYLEICEEHHACGLSIVLDRYDLDHTSTQFDGRRLLWLPRRLKTRIQMLRQLSREKSVPLTSQLHLRPQ